MDDVNQEGTGPAHIPGSRKGEEMASEGEPGRVEMDEEGADRPAGGSTARMSTSISRMPKTLLTLLCLICHPLDAGKSSR